MRRRTYEVIHGPFGFYPLFAAGDEVIMRNRAIPFQGVQLPDVVYRIERSTVAMGPVVRRMCGVGSCDAVCELHSVHPTMPSGLTTRTYYVQQNLIGAAVMVHVRFKRGRRFDQILSFHVGNRVMNRNCLTGTVLALNRCSVRVIRDDGHIETWRARSIVEIA